MKITEKNLSYRKNVTAQAPKEASSTVMGRTWVEKDFLLLSSRKGSLRAGGETREAVDGPWTQQCRMCGTSQGQLGSAEQAKLKININY